MLEVLVGAALRSLLLAAAVWLTLRLPGLRNRQVQLIAWTIVLAASLLMPVATRVAALVIPPSPIIVPDVDQVFPLNPRVPPSQPADVALDGMLQTSATAPLAMRDDSPVMSDLRHRADATSHRFDWRTLASWVYAAVCGTLITRLLVGLLLTLRIARAATPVRESWTDGHDVRVSHAIGAPATFGSIILLPHDYAAWSRVKRFAVLAHEGSHVVRRDFIVQIAASLNRAIFWFAPLSWWLQHKLVELAEAVSDDDAILNLRDRPGYAAILLEVSCRAPQLPGGVAMARPATVRSRIERILAETAAPAFVSRRSGMILMSGLLLLVMVAAGPVAVSPRSAMTNDTVSAGEQAANQQIEIDPKLLDADVGFNEDMMNGSAMIVTRDGDHLLTGRIGLPRLAEYPYTDHDFFLTIGAPQNSFVTDQSGAVGRVVHHENGVVSTLDRISPETAQRFQADHDHRIAQELMPDTPVKLTPEALQNFVGYYQLTPTTIYAVTREGDQLFVQATDQKKLPVFPFGERDFFYTGTPAQLTFLMSEQGDGPALELILHQDGTDRTAERVSVAVMRQLQKRLDDERRPRAPVSIDANILDRHVGRYTNSAFTMTIPRDRDHYGRSESPEWCPKPVTVTKVKNVGGEHILEHLGPAPDDPSICLRSGTDGDAGRVPYNFPTGVAAQDGSILTFTPDSLDRRRSGFRAVLAGQISEASYVVSGGFPGQACCWSGTETLARMGQEELLIGGQAVSTIRLEYTYNSVSGTTRYAWQLWYDPKRHLFVKGRLADGSYAQRVGAMKPRYFDVISISDPCCGEKVADSYDGGVRSMPSRER